MCSHGDLKVRRLSASPALSAKASLPLIPMCGEIAGSTALWLKLADVRDAMAHELIAPPQLWSRDEVFSQPSPVPKSSGVYAWYFREIPRGTPTAGCVKHDGHTLLYVGISPSAPPLNGKPPSRQSLWHRIRYHYRGNAEGSTLRL